MGGEVSDLSTTPPASPDASSESAVSTRRRIPTEFQKKTLWSAITGTSLVVIGAIAVLVIWLVARVFQFLQPVLVPLASAGILAYLLEPLIRRLTDRGTPRFRAMISVFALFHLLMLFLFLSVVVPTIGHISNWAGRQNQETIREGWEATVDHVLSPLDHFFAPPVVKDMAAPNTEDDAEAARPSTEPAPEAAEQKPATKWWKEWLGDKERSAGFWKKFWEYFNVGIEGFVGLFGYLVGFVMVPFYLYYFLKEAEGIRQNWHRYLPLRASQFRTEVVETLSEVNGYLIAFFRGAMLVSLIDGLLVGLSLTIFGLPYAPLIGLCVALLGLLPYVGHVLCWLAAIIISIIHYGVPGNRFDWMPQLWAYPMVITALFVVVMKINALVTAPKIIGDATGLHPLTVIFSVLFWSLLVGPLLGALLAVPLSASVKVLFRRYIWERGRQQRIAVGERAVRAPVVS